MVFMLLMSLESEEDRKTMTDIYNKYNKAVFYVALKIMKTQDAAEEVAQDVWTKVVEKFGRISSLPNNEMKPYLTVMTRNMAFNYLKSEKKKASYSFEELQENGDSRINISTAIEGTGADDKYSESDINYSDRYTKYINELFKNGSSDCDKTKICNLNNCNRKMSSSVRLCVKRAVCVAAAVIIAGGTVIAIDDVRLLRG